MIQTNPQTIQSSNPLDSSIPRRVVSAARPTTIQTKDSSAAIDEKRAEQAQKQYEQRLISELQSRDRDVRAHEAAHIAAGGSLVVSGPSFTYQNGPDGRAYAIGGEVQLDVSPVANNPQATLEKSEQIRRAALAPANPSPQDMRVASNANQLASRARIDIALQRREEAKLEAEQDKLENEQISDVSTDDLNESSESSQSASDVSSPAQTAGTNEKIPTISAAAITAFVSTAQASDVSSSPERQINQYA